MSFVGVTVTTTGLGTVRKSHFRGVVGLSECQKSVLGFWENSARRDSVVQEFLGSAASSDHRVVHPVSREN